MISYLRMKGKYYIRDLKWLKIDTTRMIIFTFS
ncbi:hypothetical protein [Mycoplasma sp. 2248]